MSRVSFHPCPNQYPRRYAAAALFCRVVLDNSASSLMHIFVQVPVGMQCVRKQCAKQKLQSRLRELINRGFNSTLTLKESRLTTRRVGYVFYSRVCLRSKIGVLALEASKNMVLVFQSVSPLCECESSPTVPQSVTPLSTFPGRFVQLPSCSDFLYCQRHYRCKSIWICLRRIRWKLQILWNKDCAGPYLVLVQPTTRALYLNLLFTGTVF